MSSTTHVICPRCREQYPEGTEVCRVCQVDLCEPEDLARVGLSFSNYELLEIIGVGGMGVVYRARHIALLKPVAIKIFNERYGRRKDATREMLREAQAASRIRHPHIVDITDFGSTPDGAPYFVMEYLVGESLNVALSRQPQFPLNRALKITRQAASALAAAHKAGIVHRDLKPENIYLLNVEGLPDEAAGAGGRGAGTDFIKILDFGLAKVFDMEPSSRTRAGMLAGTPWYMSPEQAKNLPVDGRSDVYALGVVLYQMVAGKVPFDGPSAVDILLAHVSSPAPQPFHFRPNLDENTNAAIMHCLEKDPARRFQSMEELGEALELCGDRLTLQSGDLLPEISINALLDAQNSSRPTMSAEYPGDVLSNEPIPSPTSDELARAAELVRLGANPTVSVELLGPGQRLARRLSASQGGRPSVAQPIIPRRPQRWLVPVAVASLLVAGVGFTGWRMGWFVRSRTAVNPQPSPTPTVRITLAGLPDGARASLDGVPVAARPLVVARSSVERRLVVEAPGFVPEERRLVPAGDQLLAFRMTAVTPPASQVTIAPAPASAGESKAHKPRALRRPRRLTRRNAPDILGGRQELARQTAQENKAAGAARDVPAAKPTSEQKAIEKTAAQPPAKQKANRTDEQKKKKFQDWVVDPKL